MLHPRSLAVWLILLATVTIATANVAYSPSSIRRDVKLVAGDSTAWSYRACIADSGSKGRVYTLNIDNGTTLLVEGTAPNNGNQNYDLTVIQGLDECSYAGIVGTSLVNQLPTGSISSDLPTDEEWKSPSYAVWLNNNAVQTFLYSYELIVSRVNTSSYGPHSYTPIGIENMELVFSWQLYLEPTSQVFYIAYSETRNDNPIMWDVNLYKCTWDCTKVGYLYGAIGTITANATNWFSCYISIGDVDSNHNILQGRHKCSLQANDLDPTPMLAIDADYPVNTTQNAPMYNCMIGDNVTMILAVSSGSTQAYTLYALDTTNDFNITAKSSLTGNLTVLSMTCKDRVILVSTKNGIDYWMWDDGTGPIFTDEGGTLNPTSDPTTNAPMINSSSVVIGAPTTTPLSHNSNGLPFKDQVLVGVLIGVGVPMMAGAIVLILMRKRLVQKKKKKSNETRKAYTSPPIVPPKEHYVDCSSINSTFDNKKLIPFKQLTIGKTIGSGSYGKVLIGKWQGKTVAIKMSNQLASDNFSAEAKLTLSMAPHPNLVQTYGVCTDAKYTLIVLEYCEGGSLDQIVFKRSLRVEEQRALVLGIAYGLLHLHERKIIHRDLAARNILLKEGIPKICDFGMSRMLKEEALQGKTATAIGPIRWMAPECVHDMSYSYKSDVWTFGIVVSEIVNGHEPYEGENTLDVAMKIRDQGCVPSISSDCDPILAELMHMCWKINPDDRPTMRDLIIFLNNKLSLV